MGGLTGEEEEEEGLLPLFETKVGKGKYAYRIYGITVWIGISLIWVYRSMHIPKAEEEQGRRWAWIGMFMAELWFGLYWITTLSVRWNITHRYPFKDRLLTRYGDKLPAVDIFVCTADAEVEPPTMVISTVLSVMSYNYPPDKLSVYLSDDGCSEFTFYALLEASHFSKHWIPFCKKFRVEPRSPAAYFSQNSYPEDPKVAKEWLAIKKATIYRGVIKGIRTWKILARSSMSVSCQSPNLQMAAALNVYIENVFNIEHCTSKQMKTSWIFFSYFKKLYEDMKCRIDTAIEIGTISKEIRDQHKGFSEWNSQVTKQNHQSIVQILFDRRTPDAVDDDGHQLPTLVYLAREKRPHFPHNFKAGSMNSLIRVSSEISNAPIILNVDCDMYSNDSDAIKEALCFFMDEERGHMISYVQYRQCFDNITKSDIYANGRSAVFNTELPGRDGFDGATYSGTGCFHRRDSLCGLKFSEMYRGELNGLCNKMEDRTVHELEQESKVLASCSYENGTQWGKEMGLVYGCLVEDIITGLTIQCRGWKPVYYNPERKAFMGVAPTTLDHTLVQHKRWCEGMFQILLSKYCPFIYAHGKIKLGAQMGYYPYLLWAPSSLPMLYYLIIPPICLIHSIPLFPEVSSPWLLPFAYVYAARHACSIAEDLACGETLKTWWNCQRIWLFRRTTSYLCSFINTITRELGFSQMAFSLTAKVVDEDVLERYNEGTMEFGSSSIMFTILATLALLNLLGFVVGILKIVGGSGFVEGLTLQIGLCWLVVMVNLPVYEALFLRVDKGRIPSSVMVKSIAVASLACMIPVFFKQTGTEV